MEVILHTATLVKGIDRELHTEIQPQIVDENMYPVLKFKAFENDNRIATITIFPSFEQIQEMYEVLGEFLKQQNAEMEILPLIQQTYLHCREPYPGFTVGKDYLVTKQDGLICEVTDDNGELSYISLNLFHEFQPLTK